MSRFYSISRCSIPRNRRRRDAKFSKSTLAWIWWQNLSTLTSSIYLCPTVIFSSCNTSIFRLVSPLPARCDVTIWLQAIQLHSMKSQQPFSHEALCSVCTQMFKTFLTMARLYVVLNGLISILRLIRLKFITAVILRYPTTVASHFPSVRLNYKTSTCNEQGVC
jgi:hypothetical protein